MAHNGPTSWVHNLRNVDQSAYDVDLEQENGVQNSGYSQTAYRSEEPHEVRFTNSENTRLSPKNEYMRLHQLQELDAKDIIASRANPTVFSRDPELKKSNFFAKPTTSHLNRKHQAYIKQHFSSKYNFIGLIYVLAYLGFVSCTYGTILTLLCLPIAYFVGVYNTWGGFVQCIMFTTGFCIGGFLLWKISIFIASKLPDQKYRTMNRQTGMLTFPQKGRKPDIKIPYAEFEPRVSRFKVPSGDHHSLVYVHKSGAPLFWAGERFLADVYLKAAYLEQFMDVSQPLPDIPSLEWCRDKDPTTASYDEAIHRDPNHWRNMAYSEMEAIGKQRRVELMKIMGEAAFTS
jgi:hypothetical protein